MTKSYYNKVNTFPKLSKAVIEKHSPLEVSVLMEILYIYTDKDGSHPSHTATEHLKWGMCE